MTLAQAVDLAGARTHAWVLSAGTDAGQPAVLWYPPAGMARNQIPASRYTVTYVNAGYTGFGLPTDDFLNYVLAQVRSRYGSVLGSDFGTSFGDMTGTTWYEAPLTWPSDPQNANWIAFWRNLDLAIGTRLGMAGLNDDFWGSFTSGPLGSHVRIAITRDTLQVGLQPVDQVGATRPSGGLGDIGSIER